MILLIISAALVLWALWVGIKLGRASVVYDLCHIKDGDIKEMPNDLLYFYGLYYQFHGGNQNE